MGAFGEYIVTKGDLQIKIPDNVSFEEAATLGVGVSTVVSCPMESFDSHSDIPSSLTTTRRAKQRAKVSTRPSNCPFPPALWPHPSPS